MSLGMLRHTKAWRCCASQVRNHRAQPYDERIERIRTHSKRFARGNFAQLRTHTMEYLTLANVSQIVPTHPVPATVWRWVTRGFSGPDGPICLRAAKVGRRYVTTREWLDEFFTRLANLSPVQADVVCLTHEAANCRLKECDL